MPEEYRLPTDAELTEADYLFRWDGKYDSQPLRVGGNAGVTQTIATTNGEFETVFNQYSLLFTAQDNAAAGDGVWGEMDIGLVLPQKIRYFFRLRPKDENNLDAISFWSNYYDGTYTYYTGVQIDSGYTLNQVFKYVNNAGAWTTESTFTPEYTIVNDNKWIEILLDIDYSTGGHPEYERLVIGNASVTGLVGQRSASANAQRLVCYFQMNVAQSVAVQMCVDEFSAKEYI